MSGGKHSEPYTVHDISAKAYGDFGVVTLVCTWSGIHNGGAFDVHAVMVDTWHRTDGKWQVIARNSCTPNADSAGTAEPCPTYHYSEVSYATNKQRKRPSKRVRVAQPAVLSALIDILRLSDGTSMILFGLP
jgi:Domain of unknown function (DUF4440)